MKLKLISYLLLLFIIIFSPNICLGANKTQSAEISKIETELFGFDYVTDNINNRLSRLEKNIYGKSFTGDIDKRLKKISTDVAAEQIGLEIPATEDTFSEDNIVADNSVNYPVVDEIETKLFNQTFKNKDFHSRIVGIERKLFGKIYDVDDYSTRMDRIKAEVMPERLAREKVFGYDNSNSISQNNLSGLNNNRYSGLYGQENYTRPYANYGDYLGGASPVSDNIEEQLAFMENQTFGTEFSKDTTEMRLKRLNSANKAQKSSQRYDSQKFNQRMSTVMEIGAMLLMILAMVL